MPTSPSLNSEVAFISSVNANGTLARYGYYSWNGDNPAIYNSVTTAAVKWGATMAGAAGGTVSYYFNPASNWTSVEKQQLAAGLAMWSAVANISFALTTNSAQAQIAFTRGSDGQAHTDFSYSIGPNAGMTGGKVLDQLMSATISIDTRAAGFGPITGSFSQSGGYPLLTLLHEEGHSIGLGHAGPYNNSVQVGSQQFSAYDSMLWSVMSYINPATTAAEYYSQYTVKGTNWGVSGSTSNVPTTWMPLDILAAQTLYGLPTSTPLSGGQIFGFDCNISSVIEPYFDFTKNTTPIVTLWDRGSNNTLDLAGFSASATVNLNPGTFSSCDGLINNICIAYNTAIDTAIGGSGNDIIIGNNDGDTLNGGGGNDTINGGAVGDTIHPGLGTDTVNGGAGNDGISFSGGQLTAADKIDGGAGSDFVLLASDYTGANAVVMNATTMVNVEKMWLIAGHSYNLTTNNATVASGQTLTVDGSALGSSDVLTFNGSAETNGSFVINGGAGNDTLTGGAVGDTIHPGLGIDTVNGGAGNDGISFSGGQLTAADKIDGGAGSDLVLLASNYTGANAVVMNATTMVNVEKMWPIAGHSYNLTTADATVASGQTLTVDGSALGAGDVLTFNGAAETNGHFIIIGGNGADNLRGGALSDTFVYSAAAQSTSTHYDTITGFNFGADSFDIPGGVGVITGINAKVTSGSLSTSTFDANLTSAISSSRLGAHHAVLFTPNGGTLSGATFLVVDLNGMAGYQAGADLVIRMNASSGTLAAGGFH